MGGVSGGGHHTAAEGHIMFIGNLCLLINTLASAVYYLGAKKLVQVSCLPSTGTFFLKENANAVPTLIFKGFVSTCCSLSVT